MDYNYRKEFIKNFNYLGRKYDGWAVWTDFLEAFAKCLQLPFYTKEAHEVIKKISTKYGKDYKILDKLATHTINALEHKIQDFLGSIFMELDMANKLNGQFFTPYELSSDASNIKVNNSTNSIAETQQQPTNLEQAKLLMQIKQLQAQTKKTEEQLKENKLKNFAEYVAMQKEIMVNGTAEIKQFIKKHVENEQDILEWNKLWSNYIETVYSQLSTTLFESL